ncbi:hypothetical protein SAMN05660413_02275 [Salegentibacter flavus]|uniref:Uncharacterized protein n=1 Tax=Salegentibacter flavus TaxID=287099 RepID=A0A1I5BB80_9FLAO|nr:hypothetical protein SAMN05660413_02275 [Salegentibacter flavus]
MISENRLLGGFFYGKYSIVIPDLIRDFILYGKLRYKYNNASLKELDS